MEVYNQSMEGNDQGMEENYLVMQVYNQGMAGNNQVLSASITDSTYHEPKVSSKVCQLLMLSLKPTQDAQEWTLFDHMHHCWGNDVLMPFPLFGDKVSLPPGEVTESHQSWHVLQTKGGDVVLNTLVRIHMAAALC